MSKEGIIVFGKDSIIDLERNKTSVKTTVKNIFLINFIFGAFILGVDFLDLNWKVILAVDSEMKLFRIIMLSGIILKVILLIVLPLIIINQLNLYIVIKKNELYIMRLIGATDCYIRCKCILQSVVMVIVGGFASYITLFLLYKFMFISLGGFFESFQLIDPVNIGKISLTFIALTVLVTPIGNLLALKKLKG
ncbi:MAG: hypothetical protein PUE01_14760 [Clostridiaceae bacterium]|nr:hypothetical protein [Clostridiaceae bacterium]